MDEKQKIRVLLIDDEAHARLYIKTLINSMGGEVVGEGRDGLEGVELVGSLKPDFVFLDINMPVMDGVTALKAIREQSHQVGVAMLTSLDSPDVVQHCLDAGANYHLRKDSAVDQLRQEIAKLWKWLDEVKSKGASL